MRQWPQCDEKLGFASALLQLGDHESEPGLSYGADTGSSLRAERASSCERAQDVLKHPLASPEARVTEES
eukprot:1626805-Karenia_brevis.AAC.1